jgi:hypothetical protein
VNLGKAAEKPGVLFVAMSRVRHPDDLMLEDNFPSYTQLLRPRKHEAFQQRQRWEKQQRANFSRTIRRHCRDEAVFGAAATWTAEDSDVADALLRMLAERPQNCTDELLLESCRASLSADACLRVEAVWSRMQQFPHMFEVAEVRGELDTLNLEGKRESQVTRFEVGRGRGRASCVSEQPRTAEAIVPVVPTSAVQVQTTDTGGSARKRCRFARAVKEQVPPTVLSQLPTEPANCCALDEPAVPKLMHKRPRFRLAGSERRSLEGHVALGEPQEKIAVPDGQPLADVASASRAHDAVSTVEALPKPSADKLRPGGSLLKRRRCTFSLAVSEGPETVQSLSEPPPPATSDPQLAADAGRVAVNAVVADQSASFSLPVSALYFERQVSAQCGLHALNHAMGCPRFGTVEVANALSWMEFQSKFPDSEFVGPSQFEASLHVTPMGDYSEEMLATMLEQTAEYQLLMRPLSPETVSLLQTAPHIAALIHMPGHWTTLRWVEGQWVHFDSLQRGPCIWSQQDVDVFLLRSDVAAYPIRRTCD